MPKSRITLLADGQVMEIEASRPSVRATDTCTLILMPDADGKVVASTIRAMQDKFDVQSLHAPVGAWVMLQKVAS